MRLLFSISLHHGFFRPSISTYEIADWLFDSTSVVLDVDMTVISRMINIHNPLNAVVSSMNLSK